MRVDEYLQELQQRGYSKVLIANELNVDWDVIDGWIAGRIDATVEQAKALQALCERSR